MSKRHPELEDHHSEPLYTFELTNQRKAFRNKVVWTSLGLVIGVGLMWLGSAFELPLLPRHVGSQSLQE
ncbi:MAG: hypothetical protein AAF609_07825, partial [Cyanobacteria bacterium P01_C01_bin.120]